MRIGTWNMAGRWGQRWSDFLVAQDCDVWLLTEIRDRVDLPHHELHRGQAEMAPGRRWAAVASREPVTGLRDPHPASAAAVVGGVTYVSSILPWKGCGGDPPWLGDRHADRTGAAVDALLASCRGVPLVWGGDWNHALIGSETAGSKEGRTHVERALEAFDLEVPTSALSHRIPSLRSIDHVAVPTQSTVSGAWQVSAVVDGQALSDHDAYVVQVELGS